MPLWFRVTIRYERENEPYHPRPTSYAQVRDYKSRMKRRRVKRRPPLGIFATPLRRGSLLNYCETIVFSYNRPTRCSRNGALARLSSTSGISSYIREVTRKCVRVYVYVLAIDSTSSRNAGIGIRLDRRSRGLGIIGRAFSRYVVRPCIFHGFSDSDLRRLSS